MKISYLLLALIAVAAVVLFFALEASLPKTKGQILFTNNKYLENQTSITTDSDGVVHIKAHDKLSAFFTLGFAHAQNRLWQMHMIKFQAAGRISEIVGKKGLEYDKFFRTIGLNRAAQETAELLPTDIKAEYGFIMFYFNRLQAYADGVNDYIAGKGYLQNKEFILTGFTPQNWTIIDSVLISKRFGFRLSNTWKLQAIATYAAEMLSDDFAKEILPFERKNYFGNATYTFTDDDLKAEGLFVDNNGKDEEKIKTPELIHPQEKKKDKSKDKDKDKEKDKSKDKDKEKDKSKDKKEKDKDKDKTKDKDEKKDKKDKKDKKEKDGDKKKEKKDPNEFVVEEGKNVNIPSFYEGEFAGSNAWQVHGDYTQTGKPLLSNDMHLDNYAPSLWFLADIQYKDFFASGATTPGIPAVMTGKNQHLSWGITNLNGETSDLYEEKLNDEKTQYFYDKTWQNLNIITEEIHVKGEESFNHTVYLTHHGPLLDKSLEALDNQIYRMLSLKISTETEEEEDDVSVSVMKNISFQWTGYVKNDKSIIGIMRMMEAKNEKECRDALENVMSPSVSIHFNTDTGIHYQAAGRFPKRKNIGHAFYIKKGWKPEYEWQGFVPYSENLHLSNPSKGYILSANNRLTSMNIKSPMGVLTPPNPRADRIETMLESLLAAHSLSNRKITPSDMQQMQNDTYDPFVGEMLPHLIKYMTTAHIEENSYKALGKKNKPDKLARKRARNDYILKVLHDWMEKDWKYVFQSHLPEPVYFGAFEAALIKQIIIGDIKKDLKYRVLVPYNSATHFLFRFIMHAISITDKDGNSDLPYCKFKSEEDGEEKFGRGREKKTCGDLFFWSLMKVRKNIKNACGRNKVNWQWGKYNKKVFQHLPFHYDWKLEQFYTLRAPASGNHRTVNLCAHHWEEIECYNSANLRFISSQADFVEKKEDSLIIIDTGNSEDPWSNYYKNLLPLHSRGELLKLKLPFSDEEETGEVLQLVNQ